jgi:hypothetical protein
MPTPSGTKSLAALWASKYIKAIASYDASNQPKPSGTSTDLIELASQIGRARTANRAIKNLNMASALAWSLTESILVDEIPRHGIDPDLVDPWKISADVHQLFDQVLKAYANGESPQRLSVLVGNRFGQIRRKYTAEDPRVIGFVSLHLHYTGQKLLERLTPPERALVNPYLKVMDDHMYMPLRDAYEAAANHEMDSPVLVAVQHLLPVSTAIAQLVCEHVGRVHAGYQTFSGSLGSDLVRVSSIRDVEMFQVYLCLCVLEDNIRSVQQQLFPLCVMLYPQLGVRWALVQDMLKVLRWEMYDHLNSADMEVFLPYLQLFAEMFSPEVFQFQP